jgi:hypothetical protein
MDRCGRHVGKAVRPAGRLGRERGQMIDVLRPKQNGTVVGAVANTTQKVTMKLAMSAAGRLQTLLATAAGPRP